MKKILLSLLFLGSLTSFAQLTCATAIPLVAGAPAVNYGTLTGTYLGGCFTGTVPTGAKWYSYTPTANVIARINTNIAANPASGDSRISVFTGTCAALVCNTASDDVSDTNYLTDLTFYAYAGTTYYVQFDNRWAPDADNLSFEFTVSVAADCTDALPFIENWSLQQNFMCWKTESTDNLIWGYNNGNDFSGDAVNDPVLTIFPTAANNAPKNDWLISKGLTMTAGVTYTVSVKYNAFNNPVAANESFEVRMLNAQASTATFSQQIGSVTGIVQAGAGVADLLASATTGAYTFTPTTTGVYYAGIRANTPTAAGIFLIFEVKVEGALDANTFETNNFTVYPNPTSDVVNISNVNKLDVTSTTITDLNGRIVKQFNAAVDSINISDLTSGLYFLNVTTTTGSGTTKIVKK